jgi:8-oxo-dGTP diphosphatase
MADKAAKVVVLVAACALIDGEGRVLLSKRPEGKPLAGLWEFPGGKMEPGETPERALVRELKEELGITLLASELTPLTFTSHPYTAFHLLMPVYACRRWQGIITPHEGQELAWVEPEALDAYEMPPADEPLKETLQRLLRLWREEP